MTAPATAVVLAVSPRKGGNCDTAARIAAEVLGEEGISAEVLALREYTVLPCVSCGYCTRTPGGTCPRQASDDSAFLLEVLQSAPRLIVISPIYFYHLPAHLKALIDRAQPFWSAKDAGLTPLAVRRRADAILVAARPRGEKLFAGSLVTLRFWLDIFGLDLGLPLTLYGLDKPGALAANPEAVASVTAYCREQAAPTVPPFS